ncbi:MAG: A/G-specific adenine glycosylase [Myxococcota bacterium]
MLDDIQSRLLLRERLHAWYHARRRALPWREDPTPYRVWISEIMLQQTQVATVIPYFERFIARFPDVEALAGASEQTVLGHWAGLGYYRRCRHLHAAAKQIVELHGGELPRDVETLLSLSGIGRYTAGAIASIAYGVPASVLDGNVARVISRLIALELESNSSAGTRALWDAADALLCPEAPSDHNQAMMELGALICSPKQPKCTDCPVYESCAAFATDSATDYPKKRPRRKPTKVFAVAAMTTDAAGRILMGRRPDDGLLGGLWELPGGEIAPDDTRPAGVRRWLAERTGLQGDVGPRLASVQHIFTHRRLTLEVYRVATHTAELKAQWYTETRWVDREGLASLPLSRLTQKVLDAVGHDVG